MSRNFFNGVNLEDEKIKKSIMDWIIRLEEKNIFIKKFSFLFSQYEEIVFPIQISGVPRRLKIKDANLNEYYLCYNQYTNITTYTIGKREANFDTEFSYLLMEKSNIFLKDLCIVKLDKDGKNTDNYVNFTYNYLYSSTKAVLETKVNSETIIIEISYDTASTKQDFQVSEYLFNLTKQSKYISNACLVSDKMCNDLPKILIPKEIHSIYYSKKIDISPKKI